MSLACAGAWTLGATLDSGSGEVPSQPSPLGGCEAGYWPLYATLSEALASSPVNGSHTHVFHNRTFHMPDGFAGATHGERPCFSPPSPPPLPLGPPAAPPPSLQEYCAGAEHQCTCESLGKTDATLEECVAYGASKETLTHIRTDPNTVSGCSIGVLLIFNMARANSSLLTGAPQAPLCWGAPEAPAGPPLASPSHSAGLVVGACALAALSLGGLALFGACATQDQKRVGTVLTATSELQSLSALRL